MVQVQGGGGRGWLAKCATIPREAKSGGGECPQLSVWTHTPQSTRLPLESPFQKADQVSTAFSSVSPRSQTEPLPRELEVRKSSP